MEIHNYTVTKTDPLSVQNTMQIKKIIKLNRYILYKEIFIIVWSESKTFCNLNCQCEILRECESQEA